MMPSGTDSMPSRLAIGSSSGLRISTAEPMSMTMPTNSSSRLPSARN